MPYTINVDKDVEDLNGRNTGLAFDSRHLHHNNKGEIMTLEELMDAANQLSIEDLRDLADFCNDLADSLEGE